MAWLYYLYWLLNNSQFGFSVLALFFASFQNTANTAKIVVQNLCSQYSQNGFRPKSQKSQYRKDSQYSQCIFCPPLPRSTLYSISLLFESYNRNLFKIICTSAGWILDSWGWWQMSGANFFANSLLQRVCPRTMPALRSLAENSSPDAGSMSGVLFKPH